MSLEALKRRVQGMIGRAVLSALDDSTGLQTMQVEILDGEIHDGVERFGDYGFTSVPHADAEVLTAFVGGLRSHGVVIAVGDRRYRLKGMQAGEVALYDDLGQVVLLGREGIEVRSSKAVKVEGQTVTITADRATVSATHLDLGGEGGKGVARIGDDVAGGKIVGGSTTVFAA